MAYTPQPTPGDDIIFADDSADTIDALAGNDTVHGGGGDDTLIGGSGNDSLLGEAGSNVLIGGTGDDFYFMSRYDTVTETPGEGVDEVRFNDFAFTGVAQVPLNVERFILVGQRLAFNDMAAQGNAQNNTILGNNTGNDRIWGGAGDDTIQGDYAVYGPQSNSSFNGNDTIHGEDGDDVIWGDQGVLGGDPGADTLYGDAGNDKLHGELGNDTLYGGDGDDLLDGGRDNDVLDGGSGRNVAVFFQGDGQDLLRGLASNTPDNTNTIDLAHYYTHVPGEVRTGLTMDDLVFARDGQDLLLTVLNSTDAIRIENYFAQASAGLYPVQHVLLQGADLDNAAIAALLASEPVQGGAHRDTLRGDDGDNVIRGGAGADLLIGAGGNDFLDGQRGRDRMEGGTGNDTLVVDNEHDRVIENAGEGNDTVQSYIDYTLGDNLENLILIGDSATLGTGNRLDNVLTGNALDNLLRGKGGNDVLYGNAGFDFLDGGRGQDTLVGGTGNDTLIVDDPGDVVVELAGGGRDQVQSYINYTLPDEVEDLLVLNDSGAMAIGNSASNIIFGGAGNDFIDGRAGTDVVYGGAGNDVIAMDDVMEDIDGGAGQDTLQLDAAISLMDLAGRAGAALRNFEALRMTNGAATTLVLSAADVLALSSTTHTLQIDGDSGDSVHIGTGWSHIAGAPAGYEQYVSDAVGGEPAAVLLVGQSLVVG